tara:strand:- start:190 stop:396 length:207 start_codon:yes stop_codon:yes gene_type:complete
MRIISNSPRSHIALELDNGFTVSIANTTLPGGPMRIEAALIDGDNFIETVPFVTVPELLRLVIQAIEG